MKKKIKFKGVKLKWKVSEDMLGLKSAIGFVPTTGWLVVRISEFYDHTAAVSPNENGNPKNYQYVSFEKALKDTQYNYKNRMF